MAPREIRGIDGPRDNDEPLVWKPWQPPITGPLPVQGAPADEGGVGAIDAAPRARIGTDDLQVATAGWMGRVGGLHRPQDALAAAVAAVDRVNAKEATQALGELGTVAALGQVAAAYARPTFSPSAIAESLGAFAKHLEAAGERLAAVPGVDLALETLGGAGAMAAGALRLRDELTTAAAAGRDGMSRALGAATGAAKLVGGFAMAVGAMVAPAAPLGVAILSAGAALELAKLGWDNRDGVKRAIGKAADKASDAVTRIVSNNGSSFGAGDMAPARVVANNGARAVADAPGFAWLAG